ncbi:MAG: hypothetical protein INH41_31220 [Myxococcaceae bacterium]|nr:hypothetical protein [Myxococcaceae bacterium]
MKSVLNDRTTWIFLSKWLEGRGAVAMRTTWQTRWLLLGTLALAACGGRPMGVDAGAPDGGAPDAGAADAATPLRDAGAPDGGLVDGGGLTAEPDGGPAEPTTATQVLFQDDFERWASTAAIKGSYGDQREVNASFELDAAAAAMGARSLRIEYPPGTGCADADVFLGKVLANTSPLTAVLRYRFRFTPGFRFQQPASWCGGRGLSSTEAVLGRVGAARGAVVVAAASDAASPRLLDGLDGLRWQVTVREVRATATPQQPDAVYRQHLRLPRLGPSATADDGWHRLAVLVQRETSPGAGDGVLRVWVDGEAVLDYDGERPGFARGQVFTGTAPFGSIAFPTTLASGASQRQARWFDEVSLFEP